MQLILCSIKSGVIRIDYVTEKVVFCRHLKQLGIGETVFFSEDIFVSFMYFWLHDGKLF